MNIKAWGLVKNHCFRQFSAKGEGRNFFYIYVALKNVGNRIIRINYATDFKVQDNHGNEYNSIPLPGEQSVYEKNLSPGEEYIGTIPFDVPMEFKKDLYTIIFKPSQVEGEIRKEISFDPM